jgi:hypothetical protein
LLPFRFRSRSPQAAIVPSLLLPHLHRFFGGIFQIYPDVALRPMEDLDLLVRDADLAAADRMLRATGYVPDYSFAPAKWYERHHHLAPYHPPDTGPVIELHRHIARSEVSGLIPVDDLWDRAKAVDLGPLTALVLSPEDLLLHLCLHLAHDNRFSGQIRDLCDISEVARDAAGTIDWSVVLAHSREYGVQKYLYYPLCLARASTDAPVPEPVVTALAAETAGGFLEKRALRTLFRRMILDPPRSTSPIPDWVVSSIAAEMLSDGGTARKIGGLLRIAVNLLRDSASQEVSEPPLLASLYAIFVHPFFLVARFAARVARRHDDRPIRASHPPSRRRGGSST